MHMLVRLRSHVYFKVCLSCHVHVICAIQCKHAARYYHSWLCSILYIVMAADVAGVADAYSYSSYRNKCYRLTLRRS